MICYQFKRSINLKGLMEKNNTGCNFPHAAVFPHACKGVDKVVCLKENPACSQLRCSADVRAGQRLEIMTGEAAVMMEWSVAALPCSSLRRDSVTLTHTTSHAVTQHLPASEKKESI